MNLSHMQPGVSGTITAINGTGLVRQRLFDMGLMPNRRIQLTRTAPLGFPMWVKFEENQVCLRKSEADMLEISTALLKDGV